MANTLWGLHPKDLTVTPAGRLYRRPTANHRGGYVDAEILELPKSMRTS